MAVGTFPGTEKNDENVQEHSSMRPPGREVVHAFQKKSTQGIKTPKHEIDLIKDRLKRLKEMLR